jgi:hypothetical protein
MPQSEYRTVEPDDNDPVWTQLKTLADEQLSRICAAISVFESNPRGVFEHDHAAAYKIEPKDGYDMVEIYLVPSMFDDACVLVRVEHDTKTIWFADVCKRLLNRTEDPSWWDKIETLAAEQRASALTRRR